MSRVGSGLTDDDGASPVVFAGDLLGDPSTWAARDAVTGRDVYGPPGEVPAIADVVRVLRGRLAAGLAPALSNQAAAVLLHELDGDPLPSRHRPGFTGRVQRETMRHAVARYPGWCELCEHPLVPGQDLGLFQGTGRWAHWQCAQAAAGDPDAPQASHGRLAAIARWRAQRQQPD